MMTRSDAWKLGWEMRRRHWRGAMRWALCLLALPGCELATDMPGAQPPATDGEAQAPPADTQQAAPAASNADLDVLALSAPATLSPAFAPHHTTYVSRVPLLVTRLTVTAIPVHPRATLVIDGVPVMAGDARSIDLDLGWTEVRVDVTAPSGNMQTYSIGVQRGAEIAQHALLKASDPETNARFGWSVALSGDTLVVGASREGSGATGVDGDQADARAPGSGAVYVFRRRGTAWVQEAYLKASNTEAQDRFGWSVALAGDTLAVGAVWEDSSATGVNGQQRNNRAPESGAVYVFRRRGTTWAQEAYLKASNTGTGDSFGHAVALAGDTLAVGAYREDGSGPGAATGEDDGAPDSGAVYVFRRRGTAWAQEAYLKASNAEAFDELGRSVALSGETLVVGAYHEDSGAAGVDGNEQDNGAPGSGAAYVFRRRGTAWAQEAYLKASNTGAGDWFGRSVAVAGDTVVVGALMEGSSATGVDGPGNDDSAPGSGAVYVFRRRGTAWAQEAYLKASNTGAEDRFGISVALSEGTLAVGAIFESSSGTGVGGYQYDDSAPRSGAVYLFSRTGSSWTQEAYIKASNTGAGDALGFCVALSDDTLAVGAAFEDGSMAGQQEEVTSDWDDDGAPDSGAVYLFR